MHAPRSRVPMVCAFRCDLGHRFLEPSACSCLAWVVRGLSHEGCLFFGIPATFACARRPVYNNAGVSTDTCITSSFAVARHPCGCSNTVTFQSKTYTQCLVLCFKPSCYICYISWLAWQQQLSPLGDGSVGHVVLEGQAKAWGDALERPEDDTGNLHDRRCNRVSSEIAVGCANRAIL